MITIDLYAGDHEEKKCQVDNQCRCASIGVIEVNNTQYETCQEHLMAVVKTNIICMKELGQDLKRWAASRQETLDACGIVLPAEK